MSIDLAHRGERENDANSSVVYTTFSSGQTSFCQPPGKLLIKNGINHWIPSQPDEVNKLIHTPGIRSSIYGNQWSPPQSSQQTKEPQTAVSPLLGLISVAYWWLMPDDWLLLYPPQMKNTCGFNRSSVRDISQCVVVHCIGKGQVDVKSSDYCHLSLMPHTGYSALTPSVRTHVRSVV